ncbi:MAG: GPR endopeptidase, partial [Eubacteriales bacterium]|nr:GPR endopeptidase [Eubacteriales bacterium]
RDVTILVIGLGNWDITPDSLGPRAVGQIMVTRHLMQMIPDQIDERVRALCALSPGVLGITGIETAEIIRGVVERVKPDILIAIDALAARSISRLGTTVQLSDAGIHPGSGVGNHRMALNRETLGVPVLSIGVPLVVYAGTIARDVIENLGGMRDTQRIDDAIEQVLHGTDTEMMVTPKDVDQLVEDTARMVATGINLMVHRGVTIDEIARFMH